MAVIRRVACGISGGVDSAVSAMLLKKKGFRVTGVFMRNWDLTNETGHCTLEADLADAQYICQHLGIPFREVNFVKEYWNEVFSEMLKEYQMGLTPNPDVLCNRHVKFGHFFKYVTEQLGADCVATGHYARHSWGPYLEHEDMKTGARLLTAFDRMKDQTLFLSQIPQAALQRTMFPVGEFTKNVVKRMALEAGMERIVKKRESTGICFIGKREFQDFIEEYIPPRPGNFVDLETGKVVGHHQGIHQWTKGQRTHIGGLDKAYFVATVNSQTQEIFVVKGTDNRALFTQTFTAVQPHWICGFPEELNSTGSMDCHFRYQHTHPLIKCSVYLMNKDTLDIHLEKSQRAIAHGQYAVLYKNSECLGSAKISKTGSDRYEIGNNTIYTTQSS